MDPKQPLSVEEHKKRVNIYHLGEMRDRIAGEIFSRRVCNKGSVTTEDAAYAKNAADIFVRHIAASPFQLEK